jgi:hypothetical protein
LMYRMPLTPVPRNRGQNHVRPFKNRGFKRIRESDRLRGKGH